MITEARRRLCDEICFRVQNQGFEKGQRLRTRREKRRRKC